MSSRALVCLICLGLVASAGCRNQDPAGAAALWDEVHAADYRSWERAPGYPARAPSSVHGREMDIFVNDVISEALAAGEPLAAWPEGALIVKDGYDQGALTLLAIMEKREDGWFWAEYQEDGEVEESGSPRNCIKCHDAGDDYVRAFKLPM